MTAPIVTMLQLAEHIARLRGRSRRIVFTNGCFDILHAGHAAYLQQARALGDALIVGLNSDGSIQRIKGPLRPIVAEADRATLLSSLRSVDLVVIFDEPTPEGLIQSVRPDVLVKGGDYDPEAHDGPRHIIGSELVRSYGGEVRVIDLLEGRSSSGIIERILASHSR